VRGFNRHKLKKVKQQPKYR